MALPEMEKLTIVFAQLKQAARRSVFKIVSMYLRNMLEGVSEGAVENCYNFTPHHLLPLVC